MTVDTDSPMTTSLLFAAMAATPSPLRYTLLQQAFIFPDDHEREAKNEHLRKAT